jgi:hypothetical protein
MATGSARGGHTGTATSQLIDRAYRRFVHFPADYTRLIDRIQQHVVPATYVEIGVASGRVLQLVLPGTSAIGIDPAPMIRYPLTPDTRVFAETSDDFFAQNDLNALFGQRPVDLAFIDGMHLFEFALRDFMNIEKYASSNTAVLVHDCFPIDEVTARRERETKMWTGDIWRLIVCLKQWRADLEVTVVNVPPSGLGIIRCLDPSSTVLADNYAEIVDQYMALPFAYLEQNDQGQVLNAMANDWPMVKAILPDRRRRDFNVPLHKSRRVVQEVAVSARRRARDRFGRPNHASERGT